MIKVKLYHKSKELIGYEISGHANYDEYGKDIVCASISMLAINTANSIDKFTDDEVDCTMREDGYLSVMVKNQVSNETLLLLNSFKLGVTSVKKQYGKSYIDIYNEEV